MSWFRVHCYKRFARKRCGMLRGRSLPAGADKRQLQACRSILQRSRGAVCPWRVRHHFYGLGGHIRLDKGAYPALFDRCFAAGLIERVPGCCPSHIHVPGYDAWTGQPASIGKVMNAAGSFSATAAPVAAKSKSSAAFEESLKEFLAYYGRTTHLPVENGSYVRALWKNLHPRARTCLPESGRLLFQPEQYAFLLPGCQISGI